MPTNVSAVSNDIWHDIASISDIEEVLSLEATCKFFREVVSNKISWLERLRALDQAHAPDLPHHVSVDDLPWQDLRNLVVRAHRRHRSTGPAPLRPTRGTMIRIKTIPPAVSLSVVDMELLPGGALLLVLLENGDLQCWSVPGGECVWSHYRDTPYNTSGMRVCSFAYDMQTNGNVHVLAVTEFSGRRDSERTVAIFQIPPPLVKPDEPLYKCTPKDLERTNGFPAVRFAKLSGDVLAISVGNDLLVSFWREDRSVLIRGVCIYIL
ncbi:hypothetical protein DFH11DRAFT_706301 [Phellopilus nigrolimitatus]|nr:hypothetical protein DFH11DRAFT_706301 [Phellopilus nigrolimitatus]